MILDKDDVSIREMDEDCEDCTVGPPTHYVVIDMRSLGQEILVGRYCKSCANEVAKRVREGLPEKGKEC